MANMAFKRALADMGTSNRRGGALNAAAASKGMISGNIDGAGSLCPIPDGDLGSKDRLALSEDISAVRMHQLAITLRPLAGSTASSGGRAVLLKASRWEIRKAIMSLCSTPPTAFEIEATDKSASIRISFSVGAAAEDLARKLQGVTVKIKGVKLHAFVREISESSALSEGEDWASSLLGPNVPETGREKAFDRLSPGRRPDTIVLRGIPANWLGERGKAAEGTSARGLEAIMSKLGLLRSIEVEPSAPDEPSAGTCPAGAPGAGSSAGAKGPAYSGPVDFDVNALLANMPQPRALAKGKGGGRGGGGSGATSSATGGSSGGGGGATTVGGVAVSLNVDAWVQFAFFRGFERALKALQGRVLQNSGAEVLCEYRLGVDVTGHMTEERRRERELTRAKEAKEEERRKLSIDKARGQLVGLREGLQGLRNAAKTDERPALEEAVEPIMAKVTGRVEKAEALLGARVVDEPAATEAVSHARGEIAIARLSIRKAKEAVDRAEEEERKRIELHKDKQIRDAARVVLVELEDTLSRGLALVAENREHSGIKPQADRAAELLRDVSEACSKEGGSEALRGDELVLEARKATETATTRACMLQRYWSMSARLADLRATVAAASLAGDSSATGNASSTASSGDGGNSRGVRAEIGATVGTTDTTTTSKGDVGGGGGGSSSSSGSGSGTNAGVVTAQLEVAGAILSRDLEGLSEGDLLLVSESAEEALDTAGGMLDTLHLFNAGRGRLASTKAILAEGDPLLKSSEGIMRLMAAAVISMARAQREGAPKKAEAEGSASLFGAAERWRGAVLAADSDVTAAEREVERVSKELRDKRQREEEELAARKAEDERRLREEEAQREERKARALEREMLERKHAEARIFAMELRKKELTAQVRNKAARERLQGWFKGQRTDGKKPAGAGEPRLIADRWTLDEGLERVANADAPPATPSAAPAVTTLPGGGKKAPASEHSASQDRWGLNDGSADLAERGIEIVGAGLYLPSGALDEGAMAGHKRDREMDGVDQGAEWLEAVSKRVRSTVVGKVPEGSWAAEMGDEGGDAMAVDGVDEDPPQAVPAPSSPRSPDGEHGTKEALTARGEAQEEQSSAAAAGDSALSTPAGRAAAGGSGGEAAGAVAAARAVTGGNVEAALRQRLLAAMGKSKKR